MEDAQQTMASLQECAAALDELSARLGTLDHTSRRDNIPDRSVSLHIMDHDAMFEGSLHQGELINITQVDPGGDPADIRLSMSSDDLLALTNGQLNFAHAWATGRLRLDASFRDLLRLRSFTRK